MTLLGSALSGQRIVAAHGPIYEDDPAATILAPFSRSSAAAGWSPELMPAIAPDWVITLARKARTDAVRTWSSETRATSGWLEMLDEWARAGLVLEIASRLGVHVMGLGVAHVGWRLKGSETGRFGASPEPNLRSHTWPGGFSPLTIPDHCRHMVVPSGPDRRVCVIDFKAMDLVSMLSFDRDLAIRYGDHDDQYARTVELLFGPGQAPTIQTSESTYDVTETDDDVRNIVKREIFVHVYGGSSILSSQFDEMIPELSGIRSLGIGAVHKIQTRSSQAFRAGLSRALPLLISGDVRPMFAVHDEIVLDVLSGHESRAEEVAMALEAGASERIGRPYKTRVSWGATYEEAKGS